MKKGLDSLNKFAKEVKVEDEVLEVKLKVDWKKIGYLIFKLLEPEMKKLPRIYGLIPVSMIWFLGYGAYKTIELIINLF